jgi:hypothetical protein
MLNQEVLFVPTETALPHGSHDNPKNWAIMGQPIIEGWKNAASFSQVFRQGDCTL